jgi:hypothetical protein
MVQEWVVFQNAAVLVGDRLNLARHHQLNQQPSPLRTRSSVLPLKRTVSTYVGVLTYTLPLRWLLTWRVSALATASSLPAFAEATLSSLCFPISKKTITLVVMWQIKTPDCYGKADYAIAKDDSLCSSPARKVPYQREYRQFPKGIAYSKGKRNPGGQKLTRRLVI